MKVLYYLCSCSSLNQILVGANRPQYLNNTYISCNASLNAHVSTWLNNISKLGTVKQINGGQRCGTNLTGVCNPAYIGGDICPGLADFYVRVVGGKNVFS